MSAILQFRSPDSSAVPKSAQISVWRVDYLDLCRQYGIVLTSTVISDHPRPVARNQRRGTNPIARERVSGLVQSGFNEVAPHHDASVAPCDLTEPSRFPRR